MRLHRSGDRHKLNQNLKELIASSKTYAFCQFIYIKHQDELLGAKMLNEHTFDLLRCVRLDVQTT